MIDTEAGQVRVETAVRAYNITIGAGIAARPQDVLQDVLPSRRVCVVTDETVARLHLQSFVAALERGGFDVAAKVILPPGEESKSFHQLQYLVAAILGQGIDRDTAVIALGGGVVGDIAGFAAAILLRGVPLVQVPTTLLAQVDSAVGGKTGINTARGKNLVGAFYQPHAVLIDTEFLKTLPSREMKAGYAEVVKYGLMKDAAFFGWLEENGKAVLSGNSAAQQYAIAASCRAKAAVVVADTGEKTDVRALLNFGHTFGHALEALGEYDGRILHGEAVAIGMRLALAYAVETGVCAEEEAQRGHAHLKAAGLVAKPPFPVSAAAMLEKMRGDKKNKDGNIALVLLRRIGESFVDRDVDAKALSAFLQEQYREGA